MPCLFHGLWHQPDLVWEALNGFFSALVLALLWIGLKVNEVTVGYLLGHARVLSTSRSNRELFDVLGNGFSEWFQLATLHLECLVDGVVGKTSLQVDFEHHRSFNLSLTDRLQ